MTKSYKMAVLQAMLNRGSSRWHLPMTPNEAAPFSINTLWRKTIENVSISPTAKRNAYGNTTNKSGETYRQNADDKMERQLKRTHLV